MTSGCFSPDPDMELSFRGTKCLCISCAMAEEYEGTLAVLKKNGLQFHTFVGMKPSVVRFVLRGLDVFVDPKNYPQPVTIRSPLFTVTKSTPPAPAHRPLVLADIALTVGNYIQRTTEVARASAEICVTPASTSFVRTRVHVNVTVFSPANFSCPKT